MNVAYNRSSVESENNQVSLSPTQIVSQNDELKCGDIINAEVTCIKKNVAFLQYKNLTLRCYINEVSNSFVRDITEYFEVGDIIPVRVISTQKYRDCIKVSYKACYTDRIENYHIGDIILVTVNNRIRDGYHVEVSLNVNGIMDTNIALLFGEVVFARVRGIKEGIGLKLDFYSF